MSNTDSSILDSSYNSVVLILEEFINSENNNLGINNFGINNFGISNLGYTNANTNANMNYNMNANTNANSNVNMNYNMNYNRNRYHHPYRINQRTQHYQYQAIDENNREHQDRNDRDHGEDQDYGEDQEEDRDEEEDQQEDRDEEDGEDQEDEEELHNFDTSNNYIVNNFQLNTSYRHRRYRSIFTSNFLNYMNNISNNLVNNFIDSTLNNKPVYKKIASDKAISEIQEIQYSSTSENAENMCPIYCMPFTDNETICKLPCNHVFSKDGIHKWLKESNLCPVCRYQLDFIEVKDKDLDLEENNNTVVQDNSNVDHTETFVNNYPNFNLVDILLQQEQLEYQQAILRSLDEN